MMGKGRWGRGGQQEAAFKQDFTWTAPRKPLCERELTESRGHRNLMATTITQAELFPRANGNLTWEQVLVCSMGKKTVQTFRFPHIHIHTQE